MRRTILSGLILVAVVAVAGCSAGDAGEPGVSPTGSSASESAGTAPVGDAAPVGEFPCNLLDESRVAELIADPVYDEESSAAVRGEAACVWQSVVDVGDEVLLEWAPTDFRQAKPAGDPISGVGDDAFALVIRTNVAGNSRSVVQNRLFVEFDDRRFLLRVRSEQPDIADLKELALSIIDRCGGDCGPARAETSPPPALADSACALLTDDEVASVTGVVASGEITRSASAGCRWDRKVSILEVDAARWAEFQGLDEVVPVAGVGEGAFYRREQLILTQSGQYWSVMSTAGGSRDEGLRQTSELGRLLASRL